MLAHPQRRSTDSSFPFEDFFGGFGPRPTATVPWRCGFEIQRCFIRVVATFSRFATPGNLRHGFLINPPPPKKNCRCRDGDVLGMNGDVDGKEGLVVVVVG